MQRGKGVSPALLEVFGAPPSAHASRHVVSTALYAIARECGLRVEGMAWDTYPMSFNWAAISGREQKFALLLAHVAPVAALSATKPEYCNLRFVDDPSIEAAAVKLGTPFSFLTAEALETPLTGVDRAFLSGLDRGMAYNVAYWKPARVGDVLFNWWD